MTLQDLQRQRREFDKDYWDNRETMDEWTRHVLLHIGKMVGKLSSFCEERAHKVRVSDEVIRNEVIPDLLGYALQLGNLFDVDVEELYKKRLAEVQKKVEEKKANSKRQSANSNH